ncbi:2332_t:CDS:2 [Paraglomus occultum]|uniref:2332_t:CDS:1 n=1 Tax=Paraglomus occultum TaxID=144539 RepID=A0A9N9CZI3_9GLOM|nr:2332_t:CDS:2 [Paraglomus occultum]
MKFPRKNKKTTSNDFTGKTPIMQVAPVVRKSARCSQCAKQKRKFEELADKVDHLEEVVNERKAEEERVYRYDTWPTEKLASFVEDVARRLQNMDSGTEK